MTSSTPDHELGIGVQVGSDQPGVTPAAFLAVVEAIDADGEKRYQLIESTGLTEKRRRCLLAQLQAVGGGTVPD